MIQRREYSKNAALGYGHANHLSAQQWPWYRATSAHGHGTIQLQSTQPSIMLLRCNKSYLKDFKQNATGTTSGESNKVKRIYFWFMLLVSILSVPPQRGLDVHLANTATCTKKIAAHWVGLMFGAMQQCNKAYFLPLAAIMLRLKEAYMFTDTLYRLVELECVFYGQGFQISPLSS